MFPQDIYKDSKRVVLLPVCTLKCFLWQLGTLGRLSLEFFSTAVEVIEMEHIIIFKGENNTL